MDRIPGLVVPVMRAAAPTIQAYPPNGTGRIGVAASASANTYGSWTQIVAATAGDALLMQAIAMDTNSGLVNGYGVVQVGIGAAAAEVPIAAFVCTSGSSQSRPVHTLLAPVRIPAGSRLSARSRYTTGSVTTWGVWLILLTIADIGSL